MRFEGEAQPSHEYTFIALSDGLARIELRRLEQPFSARRLHYWNGSIGYLVEAGRSSSEILPPNEVQALRRQIALRRAVYLWPDGLEWKLSEQSARCELGELGSIEVRLKVGRLAEAVALDAQGAPHERMRVLERFRSRDREWPLAAEVWSGDKLLWREQTSRVDTELHYLELFFVPPDRRLPPPGGSGASAGDGITPAGEVLRLLDTPPRWIRRVPLAAGTASELQARARAAHALESAAATKQGLALEPFLALALDERGVPSALELRLRREPSAPPIEGWECTSERCVATWLLSASLDWSGADTLARLRRLEAQLPAEAKPLSAYWVLPPTALEPSAAPTRMQLVVPFEARAGK